nr:ATP-binding protein [Massilia oculi]
MSDGGGRIWLVTSGGVVSIDNTPSSRNGHAPQVAILGAEAGGVAVAAAGALSLPAGSNDFGIAFTALGLRRPHGLRFEYRLDGVDRDWQDAGNRRAAWYTNVAPGAYRFQVRARNEDGVASANTASLDLEIAPTLFESRPFQLACALAALALGYSLYRYRVRHLTRRVAERLRMRTAERERIARTLHDSFLQTVEALALRLDTVVRAMPNGDRARTRLEQVLDEADQAIAEGRDRLQELRMSDNVTLDCVIDDALRRLQDDHPGVAAGFEVDGSAVRLAPALAEEVAEIAREAMRNAFRHAGAARIDVRLTYGRRRLALEVADDGGGIAEAVLQAGRRDGHWGLVGMRERAAQIGGQLTVDSRAGRGTTVRLTVPLAAGQA